MGLVDAQIVRVKNDGNAEFKDSYANRTYVIPPGGETFVPGAAAANWFGDASLEGPSRAGELKRLSVKYGVYYDEDVWDNLTPTVSVFTLEGGEIPTLTSDRNAGTYSTDSAQLTVEERMQALQQELKNLQSVMAAQNSTPGVTPIDDGDTDQDPDSDATPAADVQGQGNTPAARSGGATGTPGTLPPKDGSTTTPAQPAPAQPPFQTSPDPGTKSNS